MTTTPTHITRPREVATEAAKDDSQLRQKQMIAEHFDKLSTAKEDGRKVVYTFVPGNLTELMLALDMLPVLPEINALQSGMRKLSGNYITEAEKLGHSEDVCTYVKCDIGMMKSGNIGPTGTSCRTPTSCCSRYTGCFTFMKWFELLKEEYNCPVAMLHVPYQGDGHVTPEMRTYVVEQLERRGDPGAGEGRRQEARPAIASRSASSVRARRRTIWSRCWESAQNTPSPIDGYFGGVYYIGPDLHRVPRHPGRHRLLRDAARARWSSG